VATTILDLPFGETSLTTKVPEESVLGVVVPHDDTEIPDEGAVIQRALANPIGTALLRDIVHSGQKVAIVTSDLTRPCPADKLLPCVLEELRVAGIADGDITVVVALGLHRPMTPAELEKLVGPEVHGRVAVVNHDPLQTLSVGMTSAGTPVELFAPLVSADVRICLGNLEFHWFAGYSGGAKAIFPGCASERGITANHAMMVEPGAEGGRVVGNPVRADLEEAVALIGVDFILNVIVDGQKRIVDAVSGDVTKAHRRGCEIVRKRGSVSIPARADVVFVSAGGHPKDVNLYQAQKALDNAAAAVVDGGVIVWVAECAEGYGNATFEEWIRSSADGDEILQRIQAQFVIGGHKAAAIAAVQRRADIFLVSSMPAGALASIGIEQTSDLQAATDAALARAGSAASVLSLPAGGSTFPVTSDSGSPLSL